jgi:hypothetical protein
MDFLLASQGDNGHKADDGHKALMPVITPRLTGHIAREAPGIVVELGVGSVILQWAYYVRGVDELGAILQ